MNHSRVTHHQGSGKPALTAGLLAAIGFIFLFNATAFGQQTAEQNFKKLEWLAGKWTRTNVKPGQSGSEMWALEAPNSMKGQGETIKGTDTIFVEKLELLIKDKHIFYVVDGLDNQEPAHFKITEISDDSFVCENKEHDFPKKIAYKRTDQGMTATISGNGKSIDFIFIKKIGQ